MVFLALATLLTLVTGARGWTAGLRLLRDWDLRGIRVAHLRSVVVDWGLLKDLEVGLREVRAERAEEGLGVIAREEAGVKLAWRLLGILVNEEYVVDPVLVVEVVHTLRLNWFFLLRVLAIIVIVYISSSRSASLRVLERLSLRGETLVRRVGGREFLAENLRVERGVIEAEEVVVVCA